MNFLIRYSWVVAAWMFAIGANGAEDCLDCGKSASKPAAEIGQMAAEIDLPGTAVAAISLTFDDAKLSQPDYGIPVLNQYGVKGTFYVRGDNGRVPNRLQQWKNAIATGHEIGNHSVTHPCSGNAPWIGDTDQALENYTLDKIDAELKQANATIYNYLGVTPISFAYPCGLDFVGRGEDRQSYVPVVARNFLSGRGYRNEAMNQPGFVDLAFVHSFGVDPMTYSEMIAEMEKAITDHAWVIFTAHDTNSSNADRGLTTGNLAKICQWLNQNSNRIWCAPVGTVAQHIAAARSETGINNFEKFSE